MNVANPERAFDFAQLPNAGVGLARLEMIIAAHIGVHPKALIEFDRQDEETRRKIEERMAGYADPVSYYVDRLAEGIATLTAAFAPNPVIVRLSDFKSNEYANLIGGRRYEPHEENPMLGFRGASRYVDPSFKDCFELECRALRKVRKEMGLSNAWAMIPFVRTVAEAEKVIATLAEFGLERGKDDLKVIMMCELPSNALLAEDFLQNPQVTVFVREYTSQRITVEGAVKSPGIYPLSGRTSLLQAIVIAGGVTELANPRGIIVFRVIDGERMAAVFDLREIRGGNAEDPQVYGDDLIVIDESGPRSAWRSLLQTMPVLGLFRIL